MLPNCWVSEALVRVVGGDRQVTHSVTRLAPAPRSDQGLRSSPPVPEPRLTVLAVMTGCCVVVIMLVLWFLWLLHCHCQVSKHTETHPWLWRHTPLLLHCVSTLHHAVSPCHHQHCITTQYWYNDCTIMQLSNQAALKLKFNHLLKLHIYSSIWIKLGTFIVSFLPP